MDNDRLQEIKDYLDTWTGVDHIDTGVVDELIAALEGHKEVIRNLHIKIDMQKAELEAAQADEVIYISNSKIYVKEMSALRKQLAEAQAEVERLRKQVFVTIKPRPARISTVDLGEEQEIRQDVRRLIAAYENQGELLRLALGNTDKLNEELAEAEERDDAMDKIGVADKKTIADLRKQLAEAQAEVERLENSVEYWIEISADPDNYKAINKKYGQED